LRRACLVALVVVAAASAAAAQEEKKKKEQQQPPAPLTVRLNALVVDAQGRPLNDLRQEDFQVVEDGVPQKLTLFEKQEGPHAYGLVIDNSGSMRSDIGDVVEFGRMIVAGSGAESEGFVERFVGSKTIQVVQDVTARKAALAAALDEMFIEGGQTAVNDAVYLAAERLAKYKGQQTAPRRYSLVLVTDGEDRGSFYKDEQVFAKLRESGLRVFVVGFVHGEYQQTSPERAKRYMSRLAFESGGSAYFVKKGSELSQAAKQILTEMSANYVVGYDSTNAKRDGSARKVQLSAGPGAGGEARKVLAAGGYVAPKK
jgi:Ca-activated chloride channel family protein